MVKVNCSYCQKEVYKKPSQIKRSKNGRLYCDKECCFSHKKQIKREEVESRIGQDLEEYIFQKYVVEKKPTTWIMKDANIHSHYITNCLKEFGITVRDKKERFQNWWDSISEEQKEEYIGNLSKRAKKNLNKEESRDKLQEIMRTKEYKEKMSKANSGAKNGRHDPTLTKEHRVQTRALFGYKKWAKKVKERDGYKCQNCGVKGDTRSLHAHHIDDYYENEDGRMDLDNAITLCSSCHSRFHNTHKGISVTRELLLDFMNK